MTNIRHLCFLLLCTLLLFSCGHEEEYLPSYVETAVETESYDIDHLITLAQTTFSDAVADLSGVEITQTYNGTCANYGSDYCLYEYHYDWEYGSGQYGILLKKASTGEWSVLTQGKDVQIKDMYMLIQEYINP